MLPNMSGIEIARQLKLNKKSMSIPIIMLTAKSEEPDKLRAFEIGADDYITKPFSIEKSTRNSGIKFSRYIYKYRKKES